MAVRAFETEERVPGSLPGGGERNTGSIFGQQERTTELLPERNGIVMCSCCVDEERTRKICVLNETRKLKQSVRLRKRPLVKLRDNGKELK